jgi:hypothetical protein
VLLGVALSDDITPLMAAAHYLLRSAGLLNRR